MEGISVLVRQTAGSCLVPSTACVHSEQTPPVHREVRSHQPPASPGAWAPHRASGTVRGQCHLFVNHAGRGLLSWPLEGTKTRAPGKMVVTRVLARGGWPCFSCRVRGPVACTSPLGAQMSPQRQPVPESGPCPSKGGQSPERQVAVDTWRWPPGLPRLHRASEDTRHPAENRTWRSALTWSLLSVVPRPPASVSFYVTGFSAGLGPVIFGDGARAAAARVSSRCGSGGRVCQGRRARKRCHFLFTE